jgi:hypothetical protein
VIWHTPEDRVCRNGINWEWNYFSHPRLILRFGRYVWYFKRRSSQTGPFHSEWKKYIFNFYIHGKERL